MEKPTSSQKSLTMETTPSSKFAVSVDLAPYLKEGILLCGEYDLERYDCMIELPCPKDIVYVACPPKILQRFTSSVTLAMIACDHGLDPSPTKIHCLNMNVQAPVNRNCPRSKGAKFMKRITLVESFLHRPCRQVYSRRLFMISAVNFQCLTLKKLVVWSVVNYV